MSDDDIRLLPIAHCSGVSSSGRWFRRDGEDEMNDKTDARHWRLYKARNDCEETLALVEHCYAVLLWDTRDRERAKDRAAIPDYDLAFELFCAIRKLREEILPWMEKLLAEGEVSDE
jgi:hypothetical protein